MTARRVQVEGDLFHGQVPDGAVYIGRGAPGLKRSKWANPFKAGTTSQAAPFCGVRVRDADHAVALYRWLVGTSPDFVAEIRAELAGRDLACWCKPGDVCHGDVLIELANGGNPE